MGRWRTKLVFMLIVYFAGFATAIYCLAPAPADAAGQGEKGFTHSVVKSDDFAMKFNSGLHKAIGFGKDMAVQAGEYMKQKYQERQKEDG